MSTPLPLRAFQWDLARQVERLDVLLEMLPRYADWGYGELYLHLEDALEYPRLPGVARTDAYSQREMECLVSTAGSYGIKVVPIVNLLGHTQYLIKTKALRDLNELRAEDGTPLERGQVCPLHPRLAEVAEKLLQDVKPFCSAGKVHLGLDESFHLGKCPRCRADIARHGLATHFADHVNHLHALAAAQGLRTGIWADMLHFLPEAVEKLPSGIAAYDWYYYPFRRHPRIELFNFAESDLTDALEKRSIEYWGCPMNGAFRYEPLPVFRDRLENIRSWWRRCRRTGAAGFLITSWEAYRLAFEMTAVVDAAAAELWLNPEGDHGDEAMLEAGFRRVFGAKDARRAAKTVLAADAYPYSGYARWETNQRWDCTAPVDRAAANTEARALRRLAASSAPDPLRVSLAFRRYLADRDAFIHRCTVGVRQLRRVAAGAGNPTKAAAILKDLEADARHFASVIADGRKAARAMWVRTRDPRSKGHNDAILDADTARLKAWQSWLRTVKRTAARVWTASPVFGRWQLEFTVINFAPALQKVVVSQQEESAEWREMAARHTIEFTASGAKRRTNIRRSVAVPVDSPERVLSISVQGLGQVAVENICLTDGVHVLHPLGSRRRQILGEPAPRRGFPDIFAGPGADAVLTLVFPAAGNAE